MNRRTTTTALALLATLGLSTATLAQEQRTLLRGGAIAGGGHEVVVGETAADASPVKQLRVNCPKGKKAAGAGWGVLDPTGAILEGQVTYFEPAWDGSHWLANAQNRSGFAPQWKLRLRVIRVNA